jgi:tRNA-splicing ligase RtcB
MVKNIDKNVWEIPKEGKMLVSGLIFASPLLMKSIEKDGKTLEQVRNVAMLPGIVSKSIAMPDAHQGYGFSIGGVAGFDIEKGVISPGGVGYDINCGVRLLVTNVTKKDFMFKRNAILDEIFKNIPSGVGRGTKDKLDDNELNKVLENGAGWAVEKGYGKEEDLERTEDNGCIKGADASKVSPRAKARGRDQLGTLGSGNHFIEIQEVEQIMDEKTAKVFGIKDKEQIVVMIHTGSRGLGHQTASDYIHLMEKEYGFKDLPDRELVCAPIRSKLGEDYRKAMNASANFAFANRQLITYQVRKSFEKFYPKVKIDIVYDVCHNIAKFEEHIIEGNKMEICVHRKGATRAFGPGRKEIPEIYRKTGQPVIIPGSMGTFSYLLVGTKKAEEISLGSTAHGAGRVMSRSSAIRDLDFKKIESELERNDVKLRAGSKKGAVEEAPEAYKDVNEVVRVSDEVGIGKIVARLKPLAVVKG